MYMYLYLDSSTVQFNKYFQAQSQNANMWLVLYLMSSMAGDEVKVSE